jgi:hypothetical protein
MFGRHYACSLGKFRLSFTTATGTFKASALPADIQPLLTQSPTPAGQALLQREFLLQSPELAAARQEIEKLRQPASTLSTLVMHERPPENPRPTFIHNRGEFTQPTDQVSPGVLSVLNPLPPGAPANRLSFARWLVSRDQPLTARVVADTKRMVVESPSDQSRLVEMNFQVLVTWADRGGAVLASGGVPLPAASVDVGQSAMLVPEFGRSVASTQQEMIVKMAQQIVGLMEEPW